MPNHVANKLVLTGTKEQLDAFEREFITPKPSDTDPYAWSFEKLKPMPEILGRIVEDDKKPLKVRDPGDDSFGGGRPATPEEIAEVTATGYTGWYDWAIDNWGTKWDAYSVSWSRDSDTEATLKFDTAWSCPEPVFASMAVHPTIAPLHISIAAFDEGWNFAFEGEISDGTYEGNDVEADAAMHERVYGYAPEVEEDWGEANVEQP